ncbi:MAG TPA: NAD(P)-dependent oxidoreductase [Dehalococcoidia bacterium]|nr:NAD(P)-dependent oxidoreductase [Dehalococcoidia bacterium]
MSDATTTMPALGFIGLGAMGSRMARRLLQAGYPLGVFDRSQEKVQPLAEQGARTYESPRALARDADVLMSSLADDAAVEQVLLGFEGTLKEMHAGTTLIDLSSVYPDTSRALAAAGQARGVAVLDAPVSGSTPQAADGSLIMFVGGDRNTYERCRPILDVVGQTSFYMGPNGAGSTMKLVANALLGAEMQALAEAIALGERAGLDREALLNTLGGTAVLTSGQKSKLENVRAGAYPVTFALRLMWKDLGNVLRLAQACAVPMPVTAAAQQVYAAEQARGIEEDFSAVIRTPIFM